MCPRSIFLVIMQKHTHTHTRTHRNTHIDSDEYSIVANVKIDAQRLNHWDILNLCILDINFITCSKAVIWRAQKVYFISN